VTCTYRARPADFGVDHWRISVSGWWWDVSFVVAGRAGRIVLRLAAVFVNLSKNLHGGGARFRDRRPGTQEGRCGDVVTNPVRIKQGAFGIPTGPVASGSRRGF